MVAVTLPNIHITINSGVFILVWGYLEMAEKKEKNTADEPTEDDTTLCERYTCNLFELNEMLDPWEKILLLRDLPEPKTAYKRKDEKKTPHVAALINQMKDSPLIRMAARMKQPPPPPKKLMGI